MERQTYFNIWYLIMAILGVFWLREIWVTARQVEPIAYSQFQQDLKDGRIKDIAISTNAIQGT
jgi:cell division protease FtsH